MGMPHKTKAELYNDPALVKAIQNLKEGDTAVFAVERRAIYADPGRAPTEKASKLQVKVLREVVGGRFKPGQAWSIQNKKGRRGLLQIMRTAIMIMFDSPGRPVKYEVLEMLKPVRADVSAAASEKPIARRKSADGKSVLGWEDRTITGGLGMFIRGMPRKPMPEQAFWATLDDAEVYNLSELPVYAQLAVKMAKKGGRMDLLKLRALVEKKLGKTGKLVPPAQRRPRKHPLLS